MFNSELSGYIFLKFFVLGIFLGLAYEACKIVQRLTKRNIWIVNTFEFVFCGAASIIFCLKNLTLLNGTIHWWTLLATFIGLALEQISIGFFFTKFYNLLYNISVKIFSKAKRTSFGKKILR